MRAGTPGFPADLGELDPPVEHLWVLGAPLPERRLVAIVGARNATAYGLDVARALAADLAARGFGIVSGLARGVDAAAHEGALLGEGYTVAVLAGGVDIPYPAANAGLYRRILAAGGTIVAESPPGARARKFQFPLRNRIIGGLSHAVVLVQGRIKSGASTTIDAAGRIGRSVFAVPGDVRSDLSDGPHQLLRDGALVCTGAGDVEHDLTGGDRARVGEPAPIPAGLDSHERAVLGALAAGPARGDQLGARAGLDAITVARALTRLELASLVARDDGGRYLRARTDAERNGDWRPR